MSVFVPKTFRTPDAMTQPETVKIASNNWSFSSQQEYKFPIGDKINKPEVLEVDSMLCTTEW